MTTAPFIAPRAAGLAVVAAKTTDGIYRAMDDCCFNATRHAPRLVESIVRLIGARHLAHVEWTAFVYPGLPGYLAYGSTEGWPDTRARPRRNGVWLYPWRVPPQHGRVESAQSLGYSLREGKRVADLVGRPV